jgi:hypothetical protein
MRKHFILVVSLITGCLSSMAYQTPKDSISTFSKSLTQLGLHSPHWLQEPITDHVVRVFGAVVLSYCILHLFVAGAFSIRLRWINREPTYPSPFKGRGKEKIATMMGNHASRNDGIVELREGDKITTRQFFETPVAFRIKAKTNSTNIRLSYAENEIIFNWEHRFGELHIDGGPLHNKNKDGAGQIPINEWVVFDLIYERDSLRIAVDGSTRYHERADFSQINKPFSVFTGGYATAHVKSVLVGPPKILSARSTEKSNPITGPDDIEYAEFGLGDSRNRSRWVNVTADGGELSARVKHLLLAPYPVRVNQATLQIAHDPAPGSKKELKFRLSNGECYSIDEFEKLRFAFATRCPDFSPPGDYLNKFHDRV